MLGFFADSMEQRFMLKHLDAQLTSMLESSVPPVDLNLVSSFRMALQKHQNEAACKPNLSLCRHRISLSLCTCGGAGREDEAG